MASYIPQQSSRTIQVLSATTVIDVERVPATTIPHGVEFWRYVPLDAFLAEGSYSWLEPLAAAIEQRLSSGLAVAAQMIEDTDEFGLVQDIVQFVVSVPPGPGKIGPFTTLVDVPANLLTMDIQFSGNTIADLFDKALTALHAIAD